MQGNVFPVVHVNVSLGGAPAVTLDFHDTTQVLNQTGIDPANCLTTGSTGVPAQEASPWVQILQ